MKPKKITIESVINIYRHDNSLEGFEDYACTKSIDTYPNPKKGLQSVVDHHYSWIGALEDAGEFGGLPFAMPDTVIPGKTSHYSADLNVTVCYDSGHSREYMLGEPEDIGEVRDEVNTSLSSIGHPILIFP